MGITDEHRWGAQMGSTDYLRQSVKAISGVNLR